ncbi:hypothetical protein [Catellatospora sp. NPDC049133]|uniref:hypothetical protein n=1 Tax=Catellatospora sp. NPDC049133 TaxID=3155499 RepID=UPI0033D5ECA9
MGDLTRFTTAAEQDKLAGIKLDDGDVGHFMDLVGKGLVAAAQRHEAAVQDDMALSAEVIVRLQRPVKGDDGQIEILTGTETVVGRLTARKVYKDPADTIQA